MAERETPFQHDFLWGAATAGHQVGDNVNGASDFNRFELLHADKLAANAGPDKDYENGTLPQDVWQRIAPEAKNPRNYISGEASGWWKGYWQEDFDIAQDLGLKAVRFSIERAQIQPTASPDLDQEALNHYRKLIQGAKERGLEPVVTLFHFANPQWVAEGGGWENPDVVDGFQRYVEDLVKALDGEVSYFITINEPEVYTLQGWLMGEWPPQKTNDLRGALKVRKNLVEAHKRAFDTIKDVDETTSVSIAANLSHVEATSGRMTDRIGRAISEKVTNGLFLPKFVDRMDFIGANHYMHFVKKGINPKTGRNENEGEPRSDIGWYLHPESLYQILMGLRQYDKPIMITEHGLADAADQHREWYIRESLAQVARAMQDGVDVKGYLHWSLVDSHEWDKGKWPRFGLIGVDFETQERHVRPSAHGYSDFIKANTSK